jgi:hypothetical protein
MAEEELNLPNDAVCENCGKQCQYDSELCLCQECEKESENEQA